MMANPNFNSQQVGNTAFSVALTFLNDFIPNLNETVIFLRLTLHYHWGHSVSA